MILNKKYDYAYSMDKYGYGLVVTSAYLVEEVSGSRPGRDILKTSKIVSTAALFGVEHIRVRVMGAGITFSR